MASEATEAKEKTASARKSPAPKGDQTGVRNDNRSTTEPTEAESVAVEGRPDEEATNKAPEPQRMKNKDEARALIQRYSLMGNGEVNALLEELADVFGLGKAKFSTVYGRLVWDWENEVAD